MHACATKRNVRPSPTDERRPYCIWLFRIEVRVVQGLDSLLESTDEVPSPSPTASNPNPPCSPGKLMESLSVVSLRRLQNQSTDGLPAMSLAHYATVSKDPSRRPRRQPHEAPSAIPSGLC
ncbi:uncharacterized protein CLUP02_15056 [Colletotrichum lupini]|uniref:Uncharacterized protein n=1 Tax=Colletotrichum lupini TaxID=145971 RepID=A0A9Q8WNW3_9PEZI|nr:uncharacterized protein CLUP02_15056 [Colletotrichum lupini]UQC89525.1 hypothetical protein CLUP02_15056 [Colletotrichum lupini]